MGGIRHRSVSVTGLVTSAEAQAFISVTDPTVDF